MSKDAYEAGSRQALFDAGISITENEKTAEDLGISRALYDTGVTKIAGGAALVEPGLMALLGRSGAKGLEMAKQSPALAGAGGGAAVGGLAGGLAGGDLGSALTGAGIGAGLGAGAGSLYNLEAARRIGKGMQALVPEEQAALSAGRMAESPSLAEALAARGTPRMRSNSLG